MSEFDQGISRETCIAAIQHQVPLDIAGQLSCAQRGYSGNAAWPRPQPAPQPIEAVQQQIAQATRPQAPIIAPITATPTPAPSTVYPQTIPPGPGGCDTIFDWIDKNALLAALGLAALFFWRSK